jgi:hypothetical protein
MFNEKWKAALAGAALCGLLGPSLALMLSAIELTRPFSFREAARIVVIAATGWIFAFLAVGPAALVLGSVGGVLLQSLARKYRSIVVMLPAVMLGMVLGSAVPAVTIFVAWFWTRKDSRYHAAREVLECLPLAALTGMICALLLLWLFRATEGADKIRPQLT